MVPGNHVARAPGFWKGLAVMSRKQIWKATCASIAMLGMLENTAAIAAEPVLTQALANGTAGAAIQTGAGHRDARSAMPRRSPCCAAR